MSITSVIQVCFVVMRQKTTSDSAGQVVCISIPLVTFTFQVADLTHNGVCEENGVGFGFVCTQHFLFKPESGLLDSVCTKFQL